MRKLFKVIGAKLVGVSDLIEQDDVVCRFCLPMVSGSSFWILQLCF